MKLKSLSFLLVLLPACSSPNPFVENRIVLENAITHIESGETSTAARDLELMLATAEGEEFYLQRFFASYLLTQAHGTASVQEPFLSEPVGTGDRFDVRSQSLNGGRPSRIGHLVAMIYHSSHGRAWYGRTGESPLEWEGERVLPAQLESYGTENAAIYMNLCFLAVYSELNFQDGIAELLAGMGELTDLERCEALMDQVELEAELRPWVYRGVFEHQKKRDEPNAYRFAIRARETGSAVEAFGAELSAQIARWITHDSSYRFVSPANQAFDPALEGCTVTGTPNLMYEAVLERP